MAEVGSMEIHWQPKGVPLVHDVELLVGIHGVEQRLERVEWVLASEGVQKKGKKG